jgi:hypothetical protein
MTALLADASSVWLWVADRRIDKPAVLTDRVFPANPMLGSLSASPAPGALLVRSGRGTARDKAL